MRKKRAPNPIGWVGEIPFTFDPKFAVRIGGEAGGSRSGAGKPLYFVRLFFVAAFLLLVLGIEVPVCSAQKSIAPPPLLRTVGVARWRDSRGGGGIWRRSMNHFSPFFGRGRAGKKERDLPLFTLPKRTGLSCPFLLLRGANPHPSSPPPKKRNWEEKEKIYPDDAREGGFEGSLSPPSIFAAVSFISRVSPLFPSPPLPHIGSRGRKKVILIPRRIFRDHSACEVGEEIWQLGVRDPFF